MPVGDHSDEIEMPTSQLADGNRPVPEQVRLQKAMQPIENRPPVIIE